MGRINQIAIHGYKKFKDFQLTFHDGLNVIIGENESGKTTIIEAINILKENGYKGVWCIEYEGKDQNIGYEKCFEFLRNLFK